MIDRLGLLVTSLCGSLVLAGRLIDQVNTTAEAIALGLFIVGLPIGVWRALRAALRGAARANALITLLETLEDRLIRIERALGLDPVPRSEHRDT